MGGLCEERRSQGRLCLERESREPAGSWQGGGSQAGGWAGGDQVGTRQEGGAPGVQAGEVRQRWPQVRDHATWHIDSPADNLMGAQRVGRLLEGQVPTRCSAERWPRLQVLAAAEGLTQALTQQVMRGGDAWGVLSQ